MKAIVSFGSLARLALLCAALVGGNAVAQDPLPEKSPVTPAPTTIREPLASAPDAVASSTLTTHDTLTLAPPAPDDIQKEVSTSHSRYDFWHPDPVRELVLSWPFAVAALALVALNVGILILGVVAIGQVLYVPQMNRRLQAAAAAQHRDLEERKRTVKELLDACAAREQLEQIIDYSPAVCFLWSNEPEWPAEFVSENVNQFGYSTRELTTGSTSFANIVHPEDRSHVFEELQELGQDRAHDFAIEFRLLTKRGESRWVNSHVWPRQNSKQQVTHYQGILLDVTDQKRTQEQLQEAKNDLERMNRDLGEAVKRANRLAVDAEAANVTRSEFLASMNHEIRTPMNGIVGMTGLLLDTAMTAEQRDYAQTIRQCADNLLTTVNAILDFSSIRAGEIEAEEIDFDLHSTLEDMTESLTMNAHAKGLGFSLSLDQNVPQRLCGDQRWLRQVLNNVVGNAIEFTDRGSVDLQVVVDQTAPDAALLRFTVTDTGAGIPEDRLATLFEPFTHVSTSGHSGVSGTGLGLAVAKRLVEMMGGDIGGESDVEGGTTLWFTVRMRPAHRTDVQPEATLTEGHPVRVLVVDDNPVDRRILATMLKGWNVVVQVAANGQSALGMIREATSGETPFALAFVDLSVPGLGGEELARAIQEDPALDQTRVVLLSSNASPGVMRRLRKLDIAGRLAKPLTKNQVADCFVSALGYTPDAIPDGAPSESGEPTPTPPPSPPSQTKILVADDDPVHREVALHILRKSGYQVDAVGNGKEAIESLTETPYDLVLMDVQMPVMDGFEATAAIRDPQSPVRNHDVPVIAMTAHATKGARERCLHAGMTDYSPKPVSAKELAEVIARTLPGEEAWP